MTRKLAIAAFAAITAVTDVWSIHVIASIPEYPYAATGEFLNFLGIVAAGLLVFAIWDR